MNSGAEAPARGETRPRSALSIALEILGTLAAWVCAAILAVWLVGRIGNDRWAWSQWLFWVPTPAMLPVVVIGMLASLRPSGKAHARRNRFARWTAFAIALLACFAIIEHRLLHRAASIETRRDTQGQVKVVHWNAQDVTVPPEVVLNRLQNLDGDVMFLTDINWNLWVPLVEKDPLGIGIKPVHFGALAVVSRLPIVNFRPLVASKELIYITMAEIDATHLIGRTLKVYFVDLPSDPKIPRAELMRHARTLLNTATAPDPPPFPDMVVGDFNIPRGSASIAMLFPGMHEAFDSGGHGYGATYPRNMPLYHIDHMLLSDDLRCVRYDLVNPDFGRHWAQVGWITPTASK